MLTMVLEVVDGWNSEIMNLVIATLSSTTLSAQNIVYNINGNIWVLTAFGFSTSLSILIGNAMGMRKIHLAKTIAKDMLLAFLIISLVAMLIFFVLSDYIFLLFTDDADIIE